MLASRATAMAAAAAARGPCGYRLGTAAAAAAAAAGLRGAGGASGSVIGGVGGCGGGSGARPVGRLGGFPSAGVTSPPAGRLAAGPPSPFPLAWSTLSRQLTSGGAPLFPPSPYSPSTGAVPSTDAASAEAEVWPPPPPPRNDLGVDWGGRGIDMSTFGLYERVAADARLAVPITVSSDDGASGNGSDGVAAPVTTPAGADLPPTPSDARNITIVPPPSWLANDGRDALPEVLGVHGPRHLWAGDASAGNGLLTVVSESDLSVVEAGGGGGGIFAIILVGGDQVKVTADDVFYAERLPGAVNSSLVFDGAALLVGTVEWSVFGRPVVPGVRVHCVVEEQTRSRKTVTVKFKRRKGYRRTIGHRQHITRLRVERIEYQLPPVEEWTNLKIRAAGSVLPPLEKRTSPY
ncbi:hypothetical protein MMPV_008000 [Pyropia vietnamensis]